MSIEYYAKFDWAAMKVVGLPLRHNEVAELRDNGKTWFLLDFREEFDSEGLFDTLVAKTLVKVDEYRGNQGPLRTQAVAIEMPVKKAPARSVRSEDPDAF